MELKNAITVSDKDAQYDEKAKRLLGHKFVLAYILINTVEEFRGMRPKDVADLIEGEPMIGTVPIEPGMTNKVREEHGKRVVGFNSESEEIAEGIVRFDIVFYVRMKDGLSQIIINVEAQKDEPSGYAILNRAVFYVCRLVSSQKERDFVNSNYNDIKPVFSIWICMNMSENTLDHVHLTEERLLGGGGKNPAGSSWKGRLDLLNIIFIGLSNELSSDREGHELHRLLGTLLSKELSAKEKLDIMEREYEIPLEEQVRKDVNVMCNLSQGIRESGREEGRTEGEANIIGRLYRKGLTMGQIAEMTDKSLEEIRELIGKIVEEA